MNDGTQMSGPLSSNEIEDVVSSVRRLVSVDVRQRPGAPGAVTERLVLTPSLRVVAEATDAAPLILTERAVEEDAGPDSGKAEPIVADPQEAAMAVDVEEDWEDDLWSDPDTALAELALAVEEAELVTSPEDMADEGAEAGAEVAAEFQPDWNSAGPSPVVPFPAMSPGKPGPERISDPVPPVSTMPQTLTDTDGNPLTVLDEAALHDIIRQLIREELKGALGERITHNVRKLVRAEINRALTARSLD
ncbi:MAG: hypothetical protein NTW20_16870 [Rhodobacterales bacterium]|nr:hypothetical protein [Rhodobacterales bacterium]